MTEGNREPLSFRMLFRAETWNAHIEYYIPIWENPDGAQKFLAYAK